MAVLIVDTRRSFDSGQDNNRFTPSLIVTLLTRSPTEQGPWLEKLLFGSMLLDTPDRESIYILSVAFQNNRHTQDVLDKHARSSYRI